MAHHRPKIVIDDPDHPDRLQRPPRVIGLEEQELMARLERYAAPFRLIARVVLLLALAGVAWFVVLLAAGAILR